MAGTCKDYFFIFGSAESLNVNITVCPRKTEYERIIGHISKCVRHIHDFIFDLVCLYPWVVSERRSLKSIKLF